MHRIGFVVPNDFQMLSLAALTAFEMANLFAPGGYYEVRLLSEHGGHLRSSFGMTLATEAFGDAEFDTIMVGSKTETAMLPSSPGLIGFIGEAAKTARRTASICTGAFVLAEAGLLDGRRATTHWFHAETFRARFPDVRMEDDRIYINDGPIWTSAGMSAGVDLALALVDRDLGPETAKKAAKLLVVNQRRLGGQTQHSVLLDLAPRSDRIELVLNHIQRNLSDELTVEELAEVARLSPRQFSRAFVAETGLPPARAVEQMRLEAARFLMEEGRLPIVAIAEQTGFVDPERMRRAFIRTFGLPPQAVRRQARIEAAP